ncbi:SMI1/KNR4 family protein [Gimesia fumaroli]|uniref:SMI1 / KNR4 family protein n=1 Tax=Gimesia fumaroli TaxID=2527976 RepID=A0A518ILG3_9PLAN|nr:SMI1/KNR4 family protein [Gimesia fumaroli]QDV53933.1 SMI1 / KNR4 family protein [Gimesia fumaroli]
MIESEIQELEAVTDCQLPSVYRDLLQMYPQRLTELATTLDDDELAMFFHSKESLTQANVAGAEYRNSIFPPHFFIIGESGCGDYYAIDTHNAIAPVYMGGPHHGEYPEDENEQRLPYEESIHSYIEHVIAVYEECVADLKNDTKYNPPGKLSDVFSISLSVLLAPFAILFLLLSILLSGPLMLLVRLWELARPSKGE